MGSINAKIVLVGLDNSGKSSIVSKLINPDKRIHNVTPTVGYQSQQVSRQGVDIQIFDMSGDSKYRDLWINYSAKINGIMFVVDSSDAMRLNVAQSQLQTLLQDQMLKRGIPILIYANKSDVKGSSTVQQITNIFKLNNIVFPVKILKTSVMTGQGIQQGIKWLATTMKQQIERQSK